MTAHACSVEGCERTNYAARGWCHHHYHRATMYGSPTALTARELRYGQRPHDDGVIDTEAIARAIRYGITSQGDRPALTRSEASEALGLMDERGCSRLEMARATGLSVYTLNDRFAGGRTA